MALVQHRLDGGSSSDALTAPSRSCSAPWRREDADTRTMPGARRTLVQPPGTKSPAVGHAKLTACARPQALGQRLEPGQRRSSAPAPTPAPGWTRGTSRASRTPPLRATRCAAPPPQSTPVTCSGAVQLTGCDVDTLQRLAQRVHRRLERSESPDGLGEHSRRARLRACLALRRRALSHARILQSPQRLTFAFNRCIGARLQAPTTLPSRRAREEQSSRCSAPGKHLAHPRGNPTRRILHNHTTTPAPDTDPREATVPCATRIARRTQRQPESDTPSRGPLRPAPARRMAEHSASAPAS